MSRSAPLACRHCQASHSFVDSVRRLARGWAAISSPYIEDVFVADVPAAIPELHHCNSSMRRFFTGTQGGGMFLLHRFTRRHIGAARTRETSPAASSNCASYASSGLLPLPDSGHH